MLHDSPHDIQPPITNDEELANYRLGLERLDAIVAGREEDLLASRGDPQALESARRQLYRIYRRRQGILDAIEVYERQRAVAQQADQQTQQQTA